MRIDVLGLQAFVAIAERGSFRAAASHLNLSQTALSHRIRKLEESLSAPLLLRTTRQVTLTPEGAALLPKAQHLFGELSGAIDGLRGTPKQQTTRIALGCLPTIAMHVMPSVLAKFGDAHPEIVVRLFDNSAGEIAARVQAGEAEFGVTIVAANSWDLDLKPVVKEPFVLLCHPKMKFASAPSLTWAQVQDVPLVRISAETGNRILIDDALGTKRDTLDWRYEVQRVSTAVSLVKAGVAATIVPRLAIADEEKGLRAIPLRAPAVSRTLGIVTRKETPLSAPAKALIRLTTSALKAAMGRSDG